MDITVLRKEELLLLAAELGMDINSRLRKPEIRAAIEEVGFQEDELTDAWEKICRERNERAEEKEKQEKREQRQAEIELERIKLGQARLARSADAAPPPPAERLKSIARTIIKSLPRGHKRILEDSKPQLNETTLIRVQLALRA
ncbi:hypothetical protein HPB50_009441 [Hyalomma asiaticum]|uniref:Uncharacterized protein n=1 Tax=Hyalomma asiaticum TaxID=266040 RepID=A0ACB7SKS8_HYAAI|nr:hypothetical protein HPB50_009441 [Hyalomma asiaticum]